MGWKDPIAAWQGKRVLVLGDVMIDRTTHVAFVKPSPEVEGVGVYRIVNTEDRPGGAGNVAANIRSLGANAYVIGSIHGHIAIKNRIVCDGKQLLRIDHDPDHPLSVREIAIVLDDFRECVNGVDIVVISDYAKGILCDHILIPAIRIAKSAGKLVIVDPKRKDWMAYRGADVITPNAGELDAAAGPQTDIFPVIVVTEGDSGATVTNHVDKTTEKLWTHPVEGADVCGAGDTFVAAFTLAISAGRSNVEAAKIANVCASIAVSKRGTATVTADELRANL